MRISDWSSDVCSSDLRARGIVTLIDNTWATPLYFPALSHGVDISILACTKYIVGHSDVMIGSVTATAEHWDRLKAMTYSLGQCISPDDAWLAARGLRTLYVRPAQNDPSRSEGRRGGKEAAMRWR